MAPAHLRRAAAAAAAAARSCRSPVYYGAAARTPLPRGSGPDPTPRAIHHRAVAPSFFTPRRTFSADAISKMSREINSIHAADISRQIELSKLVSNITRDVRQGRSAATAGRIKNAMLVETLTWRVCTPVITVSVAAGAGYLQLAKPGWEDRALDDACATITKSVGEITEEVAKEVAQRRIAANALAEREKALSMRKEQIAARALMLDAWEARLDAWEARLVEKEAGN